MSRHNKIQKPSFGNNSTPKKSSFLNQAKSWTNPYQESNTEASEQPINTVKPRTTEEWLKNNILLRTIETRQAQLQKQPLSASITPLVQRFAEAKGQAKSNKEPLFTSKESYRESIQLKALQAKHIDIVNVSPNFQAKWLDNRFHTVKPTTKEQPIQRQSEELAQPIQRNSFDATITPYVQCLTKVIQRLNEEKLQAEILELLLNLYQRTVISPNPIYQRQIIANSIQDIIEQFYNQR
ncbi:hypothetical protein NIES4074_01610 [Cylindrospermum sp. NIES-4074]|nr:hypothetical protein NIES4074_01610 [Cylindrospermum sp. NIES-4074]